MIETNAQIHNQTNRRIFDRNIPSGMLQPYLNVRPVLTKYSILPIVDPRKELSVKLPIASTYSPHKTFNPGNAMAPWSGYASSVNTESELRNQIYALQKGSQSVYVPSSHSDLYQYKFTPSTQTTQPFPDLFKTPHFDSFNAIPNNIPQHVFYNSTRVNLMDLYNNQNNQPVTTEVKH